MHIIFTIILAALLAGCAGLSFVYVPIESGTQFEMRGLTPDLTSYVMTKVTPVVEAGCSRGVKAEKREARVRSADPQNPREYPPVVPAQPLAEAKAELKCN